MANAATMPVAVGLESCQAANKKNGKSGIGFGVKQAQIRPDFPIFCPFTGLRQLAFLRDQNKTKPTSLRSLLP